MPIGDSKPYAGLKVLDLSQGVAGPYCGAILGLQGANVIKVEPPSGDWVRLLGGGQEGLTALFIASNLGKQSIVIDGKRREGRDLILEMAAGSDIFIENFRPGVIEKLGLGYEALKAINPRIICVSITGFGTAGPWVDKPGTDSVLQAFTGMALANRDDSGKPRRLPVAIPDTVTAMYAAQSVGAALFALSRTGLGKHVQLSLAECCAAFQAVPIIDSAMFKGRPRPPTNIPTGMFATADGYMAVLTLRDDMWARLCQALGHREWLQDERFSDSVLRGRHADAINQAVADILRQQPTRHWIDLLERHDVLCGEVLDFDRFREHPQTAHMGYFGTLQQEPYGPIAVPYMPGTARGGPIPAAPRLGQHTGAVLEQFEYRPEAIQALAAASIIRQGV